MDQNTADVAHAEAAADGAAQPTGAAGTDIEDVLEAMRDVVDPELGVNVVDLGLVYGVALGEDGAATIDMTLTSAACPLTDVIEDQAAAALEGLVPGFRINVETIAMFVFGGIMLATAPFSV